VLEQHFPEISQVVVEQSGIYAIESAFLPWAEKEALKKEFMIKLIMEL